MVKEFKNKNVLILFVVFGLVLFLSVLWVNEAKAWCKDYSRLACESAPDCSWDEDLDRCCKELETNWPKAPGGKELTGCTTIVGFVEYTYRWGILLGGLVAFFALIYAGFQYLTSVGSPSKMQEARDRIIAAIGGLILLLSTFIILNTLNPSLTTLSAPTTTVAVFGESLWGNPEFDQPCEWVEFYTSESYEGEFFRIEGPTDECINLGVSIPNFMWGIFGPVGIVADWLSGGGTEVGGLPVPGSIKMKGVCQVNLYEELGCGTGFTAVGKSMPNLEWISTDLIMALEVFDVSPPQPAECRSSGSHLGFSLVIEEERPRLKWKYTLKGKLGDAKKNSVVYGFFEFGENEMNLQRFPASAASDTELFKEGDEFEYTIEGLEPETTYYWRIGCRCESGMYFGKTASSTTPQGLP